MEREGGSGRERGREDERERDLESRDPIEYTASFCSTLIHSDWNRLRQREREKQTHYKIRNNSSC